MHQTLCLTCITACGFQTSKLQIRSVVGNQTPSMQDACPPSIANNLQPDHLQLFSRIMQDYRVDGLHEQYGHEFRSVNAGPDIHNLLVLQQ